MRRVLIAFGLSLLLPASAGASPVIDVVKAVGADGAKPTRVIVEASDASGAVVNSVRVDRADGGGAFAESACGVSRKGEVNRPGGHFEVPVPGDASGDVAVTVGTGACGRDAPPPQQTSQGYTLRLPKPGEILPTLPALPGLPDLPIARAAQAGCADTDLQIAASTIKRVRKSIICLVNVERRAAGARRVKGHKRLQKAATAHAKDMLSRTYFAHEGPGGPDLISRLQKAKFWPATAGENLGAATGAFANARSIVDAWMHSSGHKANMLDKRFKYLGIGIEPMFPAPPESPGATIAAEFGTR
jgi:uncharacterized protein YkwD